MYVCMADISLNKLYSLPDDIDCLKSLKTLVLESNCLEYIPDSISKLTALKVLNVSKNRIVDFPDGVCELSGLKVLNLEKNRLRYFSPSPYIHAYIHTYIHTYRLLSIPVGIAHLSVVDLKIGHNKIGYFYDV